jgi:L-cysteine:1D-myo-inositol 2-amino-2-deoxy-alpha-D-glucopyranoside ligase
MRTVHQWPTYYVQNITDIDDDILARSAKEARDWRELGLEWTDRFASDMARLNVRPPDAFPSATKYIVPMQQLTGRLLESGLAYERDGSVYFEVDADSSFGQLADLPREQLLAIANERGNVPDDPNKKDPLDFVLWQAGKPGEPAWSSPWGPGRPGWHIECSAMAMEVLGDQIDIHGGGADLLFPHHTCSIAQSEPITGVKPWVRWWMHTAMVRMDGEKMSKSLGNLVLVDDLLRNHHPDTIRLYLLRNHYRKAWEWDPIAFEESAAWTRTLHAAVARESGSGPVLDPGSYGPRFTSALDDDLDIPTALNGTLALADEILAAPAGTKTAPAVDVLRTLAGSILGLWLRPYDEIGEDELAQAQWPEPDVGAPDMVLGPEAA